MTASFHDAAKKDVLTMPRCDDYGTPRFPAHEICFSCLSHRAGSIEASGSGGVLSLNIMHQVYHPALAVEVPYAVAVVVGVKSREIKDGMAVEVVFEKLSEQVTVPTFRPRTSS